MIGYIRCVQRKGRGCPETENLYGIELLTADLYIPDGVCTKAVIRRLSRIIRTFRRHSICRVITAPEFPCREHIQCFKEVDGFGFYRMIADVLVLGWLETHGIHAAQSCVALAGTRLHPELEYAARRLCRSVRELCIEVPGPDGDLFSAELQRYCGIPVTPRGACPDLTVEFSPTEKRGQLRLWGEKPYLDGLQLKVEGIELPDDLFLPVLLLLWERGKLLRQDLQISFKEKQEK